MQYRSPARAAVAEGDALSDGGQDEVESPNLSNYLHPSPVESIFHHDDDDDESDEEGEGLAREAAAEKARRDLGHRGAAAEVEEEEEGEEERDEVEQEHEDEAEDDADAGGGGGGSGGGRQQGRQGAASGGRRSRGAAKRKRPPALALSTVPKVRFPKGTAFVTVSLRSTGGKAPRVVSLASAFAGSSKAAFHEFVRTSSTPSAEAATQVIDGVSMETVQELAVDTFPAVGQAWCEWLEESAKAAADDAAADAASAICLVVWDESSERKTCSPLELLFTELRRADLQMPDVPLLLMDLGVALDSAGTYSSVNAERWPERKGAAPRLTLLNAAQYVWGPAGAPLDDPAAEPLLELEQLELVLMDPSGIIIKADRKALAWETLHFQQQANATVAYEEELHTDPVLWPWRELEEPPLEQPDGPTFTPPDGAYDPAEQPEGGPSVALREHLGLLDEHGQPQERDFTSDQLMLALFLFYFQEETGIDGKYSVMELIVRSTNAKATERVVRVLKCACQP